MFFNCSLDVAKLTVHEDYASLKVNNKDSKQTVTVVVTLTKPEDPGNPPAVLPSQEYII